MTKWSVLKFALPAAALALVGCVAESGEPEGEVGTAAQKQIDGGIKVWRQYTILFANGNELARINVVNSTGCGFSGGTEYWYANRSNLSSLGSMGLSITYTEGPTSWPTGCTLPPDPCNPAPGLPPDPCYVNEQSFTQPTNPSGGWGTGWTSDPQSGGTLHTASGGIALRLEKSSATPPTLTGVTWYQIIASTATPQNINPAGTFSVASSLTVPRGYRGYHITGVP